MGNIKMVWLVWISSLSVVLGAVDFSCETQRPKEGSDVTCTCKTENNIEWKVDGTVTITCTTADICLPIPPGYAVSNDIANAIKEYNLTIQAISYDGCSTYSCKDVSTTEEKKVKLTISDFNSNMPSTIDEPADKEGNIEITTDCLFNETDIVVNWYTVEGGEEKTYSPQNYYSVPTACSDTCNGDTAVTLKIGFKHTEETSICRQSVAFRVKVYHKADPLNILVLTTANDYSISGPFPWWLILIIVIIILYVIGILIGCIINFCVTWSKAFPDQKIPLWAWILCFIILGLGILTVYLIYWITNGKAETETAHQLTEKETSTPINGKSDGCAEGKQSRKPKQGKIDIEKSVTHNVTSQPNKHEKSTTRPLPNPVSGGPLQGGRAESDGAVSRTDIELQESENNLTKRRPMPGIPQGHDSKGRGLSANFDDDHPMISINLPAGKGNSLDPLKPINEGDQEPKKLKKKKKKKKASEDTSEMD